MQLLYRVLGVVVIVTQVYCPERVNQCIVREILPSLHLTGREEAGSLQKNWGEHSIAI